jgi:hypothetical protein
MLCCSRMHVNNPHLTFYAFPPSKTTADVAVHIAAGGSIGLCPEGQVSRAPPTPLQSFRRGSFAIPCANKMPIWGYTMLGCHDTWPLKEAIGGFPATIYVSLDHLYTPVEVRISTILRHSTVLIVP